MTKPPNDGRPPSLSSLPPGFFGIMEPRPYKNITELVSTLANILIAGEKSQHPIFIERFLQLYDTMHKGLALYIDQEFYVKQGNTSPIILPTIEMPDVYVSAQPMSTTPRKIIVRQEPAYMTFGSEVSNSEGEPPEIA